MPMRLTALALLLSLLGACSSTVATRSGAPEEAPAPAAAAPPAVAAPAAPERPIPEASVYPLLAAEFALRRRDYPGALDIYQEQAPLLRDPAISAHATRLAQYLQREDAALEAASLWAELDPASSEARDTLATLLIRQGRTPEAAAQLAAVARLEGDARFPALLNRFEELPPAEQAALDETVTGLLPEFPESVPLHLAAALIAAERGDPASARERLAAVFTLDPQQHQALLLDARLRLEAGERKPLARIEAALAAEPDNDRLRLQYARLLARDDMIAAREQFEILSVNNPRDGDIFYSLALINEELGDRVAAKAYLRQLLSLGQRPDDAYFVLGRMAEDEGQLATAIEHYMQVGDGPEFVAANARIGELLLRAGELPRFLGHFATLRQSYPPRSEQLYALQANLLNAAGRNETVLELLDQGLATHPESTSLRYSRSVAHERAGDIAAAETDLRAILAREPDNATALNALGYTLANRTDRYEEARTLIARALALEPDEPAILDSMGWVLYHQGEYETSLDYLTRAYALFPDPEVAAHLGEVLWASGDREGARRIWQGALEEDPQHPVLRATLERLGVDDL
ncbi:tetratricopeptide repeat protein [Pseudohaliea rubra]|uniref:TPR domain protein n=1 Tax=Pseudohaliea rubra DSM 19751 TaxID=1265313 RepID=A0A095VV67_9GAMM|nr:tetratricopeptide repeat protein [Pseudohaliea rubra]KGE05250.1 TPR domain protein [Pseudohaliea rubra DSM 19751]